MATRPTTTLDWTDGAGTKISEPPSPTKLAGYTAGQVVPYQWLNFHLWLIDAWLKYLDSKTQSGGAGAAGVNNVRLINGGNWSFISGTLAWDAAFNLAVPSLADSVNQVAAAGVAIADGQAAFITANIPLRYTGSLTSGSTSITSLSAVDGIVAGQGISGTGIASGATVSSISGTTIVISIAATATASSQLLTFQGSSTPTVTVATESSMTPGAATCLIARRVGGIVIVGVGAGEMTLRDTEVKTLRGVGYQQTMTATAGVSFTQGQPAYISDGDDSGRTAGYAYPTDCTTGSYRKRSTVAGIVSQATAIGGVVTIVQRGVVGGYTGLPVGQPVFASVTTAGGIQTGYPPFIAPTYRTLVGIAISATQIAISAPYVDVSMPLNPGGFTSVSVDIQGQAPESPITNYSITSNPVQKIGQNITRIISLNPEDSATITPPVYISSSDYMNPAMANISFPSNSTNPKFWLPLNIPPAGNLNSVLLTINAGTSYTSGATFQFFIYQLNPTLRTNNPYANSWYTTAQVTGTSNPSAFVTQQISITVNKAIDSAQQFWLAIYNPNISTSGSMNIIDVSAYVRINHALTWMRS